MNTTDIRENPSAHIGFSIYLPEGFIELPSGEPDEQKLRTLASAIAERFGLPQTQIDNGLAKSTVLLMTLGASAVAGGSDYVAAGIFRSHADVERAAMAVMNCFLLPSNHDSPQTAIDGLQQHHRNAEHIETVQLPAGEAVIAQWRESESITVDEQNIDITKHAITAWIPNPSGPGLLGVAVTSNNTEDWTHIADMAKGIFETVEWNPINDETNTATAFAW